MNGAEQEIVERKVLRATAVSALRKIGLIVAMEQQADAEGRAVNTDDQEIVERKVRRAVAVSALRKIGLIVASEQQTDSDKDKLLRWFARYGLIILAGTALLVAYVTGLI